jgi:hypothetical protein
MNISTLRPSVSGLDRESNGVCAGNVLSLSCMNCRLVVKFTSTGMLRAFMFVFSISRCAVFSTKNDYL